MADPEAHVQRVKERLQAGRTVLVDLHSRSNWTTWDIEGTQPDLEQTKLPPPDAEDPLFLLSRQTNATQTHCASSPPPAQCSFPIYSRGRTVKRLAGR